jgi:hypothetical protein
MDFTHFASYLNFGVALVASLLIGILILPANLTTSLSVLNFRSNPNTSVGITLWGLRWLTILPIYYRGDLISHSSGITLALLDTGNILNLMTAVFLSHGRKFRLEQTWPLGILLILLLIWDLSLAPLAENTLLIKLIVIAPSSVLSHISIIALGWIFFVRWGAYGLPFLLLTIFYALLQLPAYFAVFFPSESGFAEFRIMVFLALGLLKLPYTFGFLAFLLSPTKPDFSIEQYWPHQSVSPHKIVYVPLISLISIILIPVVVSVVSTVISAKVPEWIKSIIQ